MQKKVGIILVAVILLGLAIFGGFMIWKNNQNKKNNNDNVSIEEQIKREFTKELESSYEDYRIDKVEVLSDERTKEIIEWDRGQYYKEGDVLAVITYAIKSDELAGNGEQSGDWIINKTLCIAFRDGKIISGGTGW